MTAADYKAERELRGTQGEVSAMLGVSRVTIARRETGARPVIQEAWLALLALPKKKKHNKGSLLTDTRFEKQRRGNEDSKPVSGWRSRYR